MTPKTAAIEAKTSRERVSRLLMKVEVYLNYKLFKQARVAVDEILEIDPTNIAGHNWRLKILEHAGDSADVVRQLVTLAHLTREQPSRANEFLNQARQRAEDAQIRKFAKTIGLELNDVLRVNDPNYVAAAVPETWPFVPDEFSDRAVVIRQLTAPLELRVMASFGEDPEALESVALPLLRVVLAIPTAERRAVMFMDPVTTYFAFVSGQFATVHEVPSSKLGRVVGRLNRLTFQEDES